MIIKRIPDKDTLGLPKGIWLDEPDFILWTDPDTGYECIVQRIPLTFSLCGYVGLPNIHPLHSVDYSDPIFDHCTASHGVSVHGGLTFSDESSDLHQIFCDQLKATWFFGFDCAHCFDLCPALLRDLQALPKGMRGLLDMRKGTYRDVDYVKGNITNLATQLKQADIDVSNFLLTAKKETAEKQ